MHFYEMLNFFNLCRESNLCRECSAAVCCRTTLPNLMFYIEHRYLFPLPLLFFFGGGLSLRATQTCAVVSSERDLNALQILQENTQQGDQWQNIEGRCGRYQMLPSSCRYTSLSGAGGLLHNDVTMIASGRERWLPVMPDLPYEGLEIYRAV